MTCNIKLNLAGAIVGSYTNGPGRRVAIWVQGCTIGCDSCYNKELQPHEPKYLVDPLHFADRLIQSARTYDCEGITISGGEPFQQSVALSLLVRNVRLSGLSIVCFTGYPDHKIIKSTDVAVKELTSNIDVLICGSYNNCRDHQYSWYDPTDKSIIFLTDRYSCTNFKDPVSFEYILNNNHIYRTGFIDDLSYNDIFK
ncbi:4Fe-4S cluster-binding domain-containing protein [Methanocella sp. MCL-LM]|uniref:4Fe-4S cluster-binding domain-containing protein n=1 Tax=Methanocella sp. MCL-LM TaxID=3412035 RepID=UPI003C76BA58